MNTEDTSDVVEFSTEEQGHALGQTPPTSDVEPEESVELETVELASMEPVQSVELADGTAPAEPVERVEPWEDYTADIERLCLVKADDFHLLGYEEVQPEEIWQCVKASLKGQIRLHDVVASVMSLQIGKFMNWMTMRAYKGTLD